MWLYDYAVKTNRHTHTTHTVGLNPANERRLFLFASEFGAVTPTLRIFIPSETGAWFFPHQRQSHEIKMSVSGGYIRGYA